MIPDGKPANILWIVLLCVCLTLAVRFRTQVLSPSDPHWSDPTDHWKYEYVAEHPVGSFHIQPSCWRIGIPLLSRLLPFSTYRNFDVLNIVFYILTGILIYLWLLAMPRPPGEALLGVLMFYSMGAAIKVVLAGVETPDPGSYFFTVLALYAIYTDRDYLCASALALGMLTKETLMVAVPLHYSLKAVRLWDPARLKRSILVALPAVCIFIGIRLAIPAWNDRADYVASLPAIYTQVSAGDVKYDVWTAFLGTMSTYRGWTAIDLVRLFTWGSLGIYLFLPFFAWRRNRMIFVRWAPYWFIIVATLLIALNADRRLGSLFPLLIVTGLNGVRSIAERLGLEVRDLRFIFVIQLALLLLKRDVEIVPFDLSAAVFLLSLAWVFVRSGARIASPGALTSAR